MKDIVFINIDPGTSEIKVIGRYKNVVKELSLLTYCKVGQGNYVGQKDFTVTQPEQHCGLGGDPVRFYDAENSVRENNFYTTPKFPCLMFLVIGKMLNLLNAPETVTVWLGLALPHSHMGKTQALQDMFQKSWPVQIGDGLVRRINIEKVIVDSQPACVAKDLIFQYKQNGKGLELKDDRGQRVLQRGPLHIMLPGSNSFEQGYFAGSFKAFQGQSVFRGTFDLLESLREKAYAEHGMNFSQYELMYEGFRKGSVKVQGEVYQFATINRTVVQEYFGSEDFAQHVRTFLNNYRARPVTLVLAGGTILHAEMVFRQQFGSMYEKQVVALDDEGNPEPWKSVVRGLDKGVQVTWLKNQ